MPDGNTITDWPIFYDCWLSVQILTYVTWYICVYMMLHILTHWGQVRHICVGKLNISGSDNGLAPVQAPSHYLNQCWNIVDWTIGNKLHWIFNPSISIQENGFENFVCEMGSNLVSLLLTLTNWPLGDVSHFDVYFSYNLIISYCTEW